jgi:tRNA (mo5U34)-methyltransferase
VTATGDLRQRADELLWYHTIELPGGVVTPGWFDLRPIVELMPWPDVRGKRCLDVGTYDGFIAFELERRGAAEVVAVDINDHTKWDWPPDVRATGADNLAKLAGPERGGGFRLAAEALGSKVELRSISVYDLDPKEVGTFDVVTCGSLLLHLRDPMRALEAIRGVCGGVFLSAEQIDLPLTLRSRRRPLARLNGVGSLCQWWVPNRVGHLQMLRSAGFAVDKVSRRYAIPYGARHPSLSGVGPRAGALVQRATLGGIGVPHSAALVHPVV